MAFVLRARADRPAPIGSVSRAEGIHELSQRRQDHREMHGVDRIAERGLGVTRSRPAAAGAAGSPEAGRAYIMDT